jgi:hypothetical protein
MAYILCNTTSEATQANPWDAITVDRPFFYDLLLQNALLGNVVVLQAADVFRHAVVRQELVETNKSLARQLLQWGHVKILGELTEPPATYHIHAKKIASILALVRSSQAQIALPESDSIDKHFMALVHDLPRQQVAEGGFFLGDIPEREFSLILTSFFKRSQQHRGSRVLFQSLLDTLYGQTQGPWQSAGKRTLIHLLSDLHLCATAQALQHTAGVDTGVDTQWAPVVGRVSRYHQLQMAPLSGPVSLIKLPWPNALINSKVMQKILQPDALPPCREAFVAAWKNMSCGVVTRPAVEALCEAAEGYNRFLHQCLVKSGDREAMGNPANLLLSFEPTSFAGSPVVGEVYWQQAFSGVKRVMALWNFKGNATGPVNHQTLPAYQLIYGKKKLANVLL